MVDGISKNQKRITTTSLLKVTTYILIFILPFLFGFYGFLRNPPLNGESVIAVLRILSIAQASTIAIVISVTFLGIRLTENRYSPHLVTLFTQGLLFQSTFFGFLFSIFCDLWLIIRLPEGSLSPLQIALSFIAFGLAISMAIQLYLYTQIGIKRTTPRGIIKLTESNISKAGYIVQIRKSLQDHTSKPHPLKPLFLITVSALADEDISTAETGVLFYCLAGEKVINHHTTYNKFPADSTSENSQMFGPPLEEHLPKLILESEKRGTKKITLQILDFIEYISWLGVNSPNAVIPQQAINGLFSTLEKGYKSEDQFDDSLIWDKITNVLESTVSTSASNRSKQMLSTVEEHSIKLLEEGEMVEDYEMTNEIGENLFSLQQPLLSVYYKQDYVDGNMLSDHWDRNQRVKNAYNTLQQWSNTMLSFSLGVIKETVNEEDEYSEKLYSSIAVFWRDACLNGSDEGIGYQDSNHKDRIYEFTLIVALTNIVLQPDEIKMWSQNLAQVCINGDREKLNNYMDSITYTQVARKVDGLTEDNKNYPTHIHQSYQGSEKIEGESFEEITRDTLSKAKDDFWGKIKKEENTQRWRDMDAGEIIDTNRKNLIPGMRTYKTDKLERYLQNHSEDFDKNVFRAVFQRYGRTTKNELVLISAQETPNRILDYIHNIDQKFEESHGFFQNVRYLIVTPHKDYISKGDSEEVIVEYQTVDLIESDDQLTIYGSLQS